MTNSQENRISALNARALAQEIAFAPFSFYAAVVLRDAGLLEEIEKTGDEGVSAETLSEETGLTRQGVEVLLDFGKHLHLVEQDDGRFNLGPVGYMILHDKMTEINMNVTRDLCYRALPFLEESVREGEPEGLQTLGSWDTFYEGLPELPEQVRDTWLRFDHFYSDQAYDDLLPIVLEDSVDALLDVGANTGKWALKCLEHDPEVEVTLLDMPETLELARDNIKEAGFQDRVHYVEGDLLEDENLFPENMDVIWMCQLLDCFGTEDIVTILRKTREVMSPDTRLYIVELFPDRQDFDQATFCLDAISLYFICIANGESRMYRYDRMKNLIQQAGLYIEEEKDVPSSHHTVLRCKRD